MITWYTARKRLCKLAQPDAIRGFHWSHGLLYDNRGGGGQDVYVASTERQVCLSGTTDGGGVSTAVGERYGEKVMLLLHDR